MLAANSVHKLPSVLIKNQGSVALSRVSHGRVTGGILFQEYQRKRTC